MGIESFFFVSTWLAGTVRHLTPCPQDQAVSVTQSAVFETLSGIHPEPGEGLRMRAVTAGPDMVFHA